jgi:hypothetical protein
VIESKLKNFCGDWLALALNEAFRTEDTSFDLTALKACLKENDIEAPRVDMESHGATGRFRMVAGLMLRAAAKRGPIVIDGSIRREARFHTRREEARAQGEDDRGGGISPTFCVSSSAIIGY